jgi:hypothetical protein
MVEYRLLSKQKVSAETLANLKKGRERQAAERKGRHGPKHGREGAEQAAATLN